MTAKSTHSKAHDKADKSDEKDTTTKAADTPTPAVGKSKDMSADPGETPGLNPAPETVTSPAKKNPAGLNVVDAVVQGQEGATAQPDATTGKNMPAGSQRAPHLMRVGFDVATLEKRLHDHRQAQSQRDPASREATPGAVSFRDVPPGSSFLSGGKVYTKSMDGDGQAWDHDAATVAKFAPGSKHDKGPSCVVLPPMVLQPDHERVDAATGQGLARSWRNALGMTGAMKSEEVEAEKARAMRQTNKTAAELDAETANIGRPGSAHAGGTELPGRS